MFQEIPREGQGDPQRPPKTATMDDTSIAIPGVDGQGQIEAEAPSRIRANPEEPIPPEPQAQFLERVQHPETGDEPEEQPQEQAQDQAQEALTKQEKISRENFLKATGFKSYDEAYKSLKEGQATITKKSQKEKQLEQEINEMKETLQMLSYQQYQQPPAQQPAGQGDEDIDIFEDPKAINRLVDKKVTEKVQSTLQRTRMEQDIAEVRGEDPQTWDIMARSGFLNEAFKRKPFLNNMGMKGLRQAKSDAVNLFREYSQTVDNIMKGGSANPPQQPVQANESEEQMRTRLLSEQDAAIAATLPQGGTARGIQRDRDAEKAAAVKNNDPFKLAEILLEGMT